MKTIISFLTLALLTQSAVAADYEAQVRRQKVCSQMGEIGAMFYKLKEQGTSYNEVSFDKTTRSGRISEEIAHYGYYEASDLKDAYMRGWAKCMDSLAAYD